MSFMPIGLDTGPFEGAAGRLVWDTSDIRANVCRMASSNSSAGKPALLPGRNNMGAGANIDSFGLE